MTVVQQAERMSAVDRAWLEMDDPHNPMIVSAIFQLEGPVDAAHLQQVMVERLLRYPRFRQCVDRTYRIPRWVEDTALDYRYHVHVRRLPRGAGDQELRKAISTEVSRELDLAQPLWRLILFPRPNGPVTVLFRAHHALADGIALVTLLIDSTDKGFLRAPAPPENSGAQSPHPGPLGGLVDRLTAVNDGLIKLSAMTRNKTGRAQLRQQLNQGRDAVAGVRRILALPEDHPTSLRQPLSGRKIVTWINDVPLLPLRHQAKRLQVRVNDLLMAALAGALSSQLRRGGDKLADTHDLRISVPVNLRSGKGRELGNQFGLILLELPVGVESLQHRLRIVAQRMTELKTSSEARATMLGLTAAGHLPVPLERRLVGRISAKSVAVVSSLPGPKRHVRIADARMNNLVFWPPQSGGIGLGISFFSYAGQLSIGVSADTGVRLSPRKLIEAFRTELEELLALAPGAELAEKAPASS
ncbi:MAG: wax ester/triacylglycerol synthase family O-acyltransferase [Nevskia sp.]|nr:wax ester/triacylglycerol synthase family O-acyltransferase [Nevskia sp.]